MNWKSFELEWIRRRRPLCYAHYNYNSIYHTPCSLLLIVVEMRGPKMKKAMPECVSLNLLLSLRRQQSNRPLFANLQARNENES